MANIGTYQLSDIENELEGMAHGTTLNNVTNLFGVFDRAARRIMKDVDPQETKIVAQFGKVYNGVFDYPLFTDLKGNKVIDFYPQANRTLLDNYSQKYNKEFDLWKNLTITPDFTPRYSNGTRTIRLAANNLTAGIQLNAADGVMNNGTWQTGGNANNIQNNNLFYTDGVSGSVSCSLAATGIAGSKGYLENSTFTPVNLTENFNNNSDQFFYVSLPNAASFSAIEIRFGTDANDYYVLSGITTDALGSQFQTGFNLIKVPFTAVTTVGAPNLASIGYIRVTFTYDGTLQNQVLINQFYSRIGFIFNMEYYSKYLFRDANTGIFQEKATDVSNFVNLDTDSMDLFIYATGCAMVQQQQGLDALFYDANDFEGKYQDTLAAYKNKYKSEVTKPSISYYNLPQAGYRRWMGYGSNSAVPPA